MLRSTCLLAAVLAVMALTVVLVSRTPAPEADAVPATVKEADCLRAAGAIKIDGKADEGAWAKAPVLKDFAVFWQRRPARSKTEARLLWDDDFLYFTAKMEDVDLYADVKQYNGMTWTNDVFELFFKPDMAKKPYYEFQVNALNTRMETFLPSRGAGGFQRFATQEKLGMESAVVLRGTLNNWKDRDEGWTVEGRIPWKAFQETGGRPKAGDRWKFALCRYDYSVAYESPDLSSTAPLTQPDFHRYEDYGTLKFVGAE
jgi:cellulose/xylan binding protein with CBM9 domain